jgi:WhiB family transcriptional regulator, redox-sensing transcriptional regulator
MSIVGAGIGEIHNTEPWTEKAHCRDEGPNDQLWFPEAWGRGHEGKAVCRGCPVRAKCLDYAMENGERYGIWGGLSTKEREELRRRTGKLRPFHNPTCTCAVCVRRRKA